ncbi:glutamate-cysteine ligase family protein [Streptomyces sp. NPDC127051]|uniref:glutamate-cysteine ligase family protein n=1 Tax=Streptomyces sp. NPDC127051 TaxID=3347119 RepID=UPI003669553E
MDRHELVSFFHGSPGKRRVGVEIECAAISSSTSKCLAYDGPEGLKHLLLRTAASLGAGLIHEEGTACLTGVRLLSGASISLEPGGAIEYSSAPAANVSELADIATADLRHIADICRGQDIALLPGGNNPFAEQGQLRWTPSRKVDLLRKHYAALGVGPVADLCMASNLSTQVTLDYSSPTELCEQLNMQTLVSPVIKAMFVNSPFHARRPSGFQSHRLHLWTATEPLRAGALPTALSGKTTVDELVDWLVRLPMIYRLQKGQYVPAGTRAFAELDGVNSQDWQTHLNQIWKDARPRRTIELRGADGPPWPHVFSAPALWEGLSYVAEVRRSVIALIGPVTREQHTAATLQAALHGLQGTYKGVSLRELATDVIRLAQLGLKCLVERGEEKEECLGNISVLDDVVCTGETFAQRSRSRWPDLGRDHRKYVEYHRIR